VKCPECGWPTQSGDRYCVSCGAELGGVAPKDTEGYDSSKRSIHNLWEDRMGIREPGALLKAIEQMRIDIAESDTETRVVYADFDSLLILLETAREVAREELVVEWLEWNVQSPDSTNETARSLLQALADLDRPFEHDMPPIQAEEPCGSISYDGLLKCDRPVNYSEDHGQETPGGLVRWARLCKATPDKHDALLPVPYCDRDADHDGEHYDSSKGVSW